MKSQSRHVKGGLGSSLPMTDGREKVMGQAKYAADVTLPGMLHLRPIFSPHAHARIKAINKDPALRVPGVVDVLTAKDLPAASRRPTNRNSAILAGDRVVFQGQPVAIVVAESEVAAQDSADCLVINYEPLAAAIDPVAAMDDGGPLVWPEGLAEADNAVAEAHTGGAGGAAEQATGGNVSATVHFKRGDVQVGFAEADLILERSYRTHIVHQAYLEPHAAVAAVDPVDGKLTIWTSTQGQFLVRDEVARLLGLPKSQVRIIPMKVGGGFGAKYGILESLLGAAAFHLKRPVRMVLTRSEDFLTTTPTPACLFDLKTGVKKDGLLTSLQARVVLDSGAFPAHLTTIICTLLGGYYRFPNLEIRAYEVLTHKPMVGAYRAPTAPQATFAIESQMDEMARKLSLDPLQFRLENAIETGDPMPDNKAWPSVGLKACLERIADHPLWRDRLSVRGGRGVGLAIGGWPGGAAPAAAVCRADSDGTIYLHLGSVDITGSNTAMRQMAAEVLGVSPDTVQVLPGDTEQGPFAGHSGGSMITYTVGTAVIEAAKEVRKQILVVAAEMMEASSADLEISEGWVSVRGVPSRRLSVAEVAAQTLKMGGRHRPIICHGSSALAAQQSPVFTAQLVEVAVDPDTGQVEVVHNVIAQDVGRAINPLLIEGQVHGGATQGIGFALLEQLLYDEGGQLLTGSFMDYALPNASRVPSFEVLLIENPSPDGPFGARGVGEPPIIAGAAAIANAVRQAVGVGMTELPITPERLWRALHQVGNMSSLGLDIPESRLRS